MAITSTIYWAISGSTLSLGSSSISGTYSGSFAGTTYYSSQSDVPWYSYASDIETIRFKNTIVPQYTARWFYDCENLTTINSISNLDTSLTESMASMFDGCSSLTSLNLTSFDTSSVTSMYAMFYNCASLASLNVSSFNTSNVTNMEQMFMKCSSLTSLDVTLFHTSKVTNMNLMFSNCSSLTSLNLLFFDTSNTRYIGRMFNGCSSLTSLNLTSFDVSNIIAVTRMFYDCENLETVYVSSSWSLQSGIAHDDMFTNCYSIVGGNGTTYDSSYVTSTYARIDTASTPGYFTEGQTRLIYWGITDNVLTLNNVTVNGTTDNGSFNGTVTYTLMPWSDYFNRITSINIRSVISPTTTDYWFAYLTNVTTIANPSNLNMSNVTSMQYMFSYVTSSSASFDLTSWDTSSVTSMYRTFSHFGGTVDISTWNTSSLTDMSFMFEYATNIPLLTSFNTSNVTNMSWTFAYTDATLINLSSFNTSRVTTMSGLFYNATNLTKVYVGSGWTTANLTYDNDMFTGCTSIVGGNGTTYDADYTDKTYARIDTASTPGYFSEPRTEIYPFIGVNSVARQITDMYIGVNGVARKVLKGYIGVSGVAHQFFGNIYTPTNSYSVAKESGASYGFEQCSNTSDTYYFSGESSYDNTWCRSTNYNIHSSSASSIITLEIEEACTVTIDVVDYQNESRYDYGFLYALDDDGTAKYSGSSNHISGGTTVNYGTVAVGTHTIFVGYIKDSSVNKANDRLYFRVKFDGEAIAPTSVTT